MVLGLGLNVSVADQVQAAVPDMRPVRDAALIGGGAEPAEVLLLCDDDPDCGSGASCISLVGGFVCACDPGYRTTGSGCEDIHECDEGLDRCAAVATCTPEFVRTVSVIGPSNRLKVSRRSPFSN